MPAGDPNPGFSPDVMSGKGPGKTGREGPARLPPQAPLSTSEPSLPGPRALCVVGTIATFMSVGNISQIIYLGTANHTCLGFLLHSSDITAEEVTSLQWTRASVRISAHKRELLLTHVYVVQAQRVDRHVRRTSVPGNCRRKTEWEYEEMGAISKNID